MLNSPRVRRHPTAAFGRFLPSTNGTDRPIAAGGDSQKTARSVHSEASTKLAFRTTRQARFLFSSGALKIALQAVRRRQ